MRFRNAPSSSVGSYRRASRVSIVVIAELSTAFTRS